jgi:8-oxo-dGTP pyrophosphatase MutT (NUDIX family)
MPSPQQAAAIPIRRSGQAVEICLIRKKESDVWGIPKGSVDSGDTHATTALKEAWEEAGLRGRLIGDPLGTYRYEKFGRSLVVMVYLMEVLEQYDAWQEAGIRERKWHSFTEAVSMLSDHPAHGFLTRAMRLFPEPR